MTNLSNVSEMSQVRQNRVELHPVIANRETGQFLNIHLLYEVLPVYESYNHFFEDDGAAKPDQDYKEWLAANIAFINSNYPWFFVVSVNGMAEGAIWANDWDSFGGREHSVCIGGFAKRGTQTVITTETIRQIVAKLFNETEVYIVRAETHDANRPARLACLRAGLRSPEKRRAYRIFNHEVLNAVVYSITRDEWDREHTDNVSTEAEMTPNE